MVYILHFIAWVAQRPSNGDGEVAGSSLTHYSDECESGRAADAHVHLSLLTKQCKWQNPDFQTYQSTSNASQTEVPIIYTSLWKTYNCILCIVLTTRFEIHIFYIQRLKTYLLFPISQLLTTDIYWPNHIWTLLGVHVTAPYKMSCFVTYLSNQKVDNVKSQAEITIPASAPEVTTLWRYIDQFIIIFFVH